MRRLKAGGCGAPIDVWQVNTMLAAADRVGSLLVLSFVLLVWCKLFGPPSRPPA
jgi:hypothetical protein